MSLNEDDTRNLCIDKFNELIDDEDISSKIEEGIFQYVVINICQNKNLPINWNNSYFKRAYLNKCISLYSNLNKNSYLKNTELIDKIKSNLIDPSKLAFMNPQELFPKNWETFVAKKQAKDEFLYTKKLESFTDEYKCGRCKQSKCSMYQCQTRSADEGMLTYITCLNCGHKWKF